MISPSSTMISPSSRLVRSHLQEQSLAPALEKLETFQDDPLAHDRLEQRFERTPSAHNSYPSTVSGGRDLDLQRILKAPAKEQRAFFRKMDREYFLSHGLPWNSPPPTPPTPPPPSEEEISLAHDSHSKLYPQLSLDDLPRGYRGGIFDINPDAPEADEERIRMILPQFYEEGWRSIKVNDEGSWFWHLQRGLAKEEYVEKRVDEIFDKQGMVPPSKSLLPPLSYEEKALREDRRLWLVDGPHLSLDELTRGYRGGIFDVNPDAPAADEDRIRRNLVQFWKEGQRCINSYSWRCFFVGLQRGMTKEQYIEMRLDEIFTEQNHARPSNSTRRVTRVQTRASAASKHQSAQNLPKVSEAIPATRKHGKNARKSRLQVAVHPSRSHNLIGPQERHHRKRAVQRRQGQEMDGRLTSDEGPVSSRLRSSGCVI